MKKFTQQITTNLLFIAIVLLANTLPAQSTDVLQRARNTISLGVSGYNQFVGINFEHLWLLRKHSNFSFRVGIPWINTETRKSYLEQTGKSLSAGLGFVVGQRSSFLDLSVNYNIMHGLSRNDESLIVVQMPTVFAGYRLQKPHGGFFLKAGVSAGALLRSWRAPQTIILPTLDIGYTVPGKDAHRLLSEKRAAASRRKMNRPVFSRQLFLTGFAGTGINRLQQRAPYRSGGQGGGTNYTLRPKQNLAGLQLGGTLEWRYSQHVGLSTGLTYSHESLDFRYSLTSHVVLPTYMSSSKSGELQYTLPTLRIPLHLHVNFGETSVFSLLAGPYLAFPLAWKAHGVYDQTVLHRAYNDASSILTNYAPHSRLGLTAGFQFRLPLGDKSHLQLRARVGHDLNKILIFTPDAGLSWLNVDVGYGVRLH